MLRAIAVVAAAVPFLFAAIRAMGTGFTDLRYLPMAVVSQIASMAVLMIGDARRKPRNAVLVLAVVAFFASTLLALAAGWLVGARNTESMLIVAAGFAFWSALGNSLTSLVPRR